MGGKVKQVGKEWHEFWEKFGAGMIEVSHAPAILGATNDALGWLREKIGAGALDEDFRRATDRIKEFQLGLSVVRPTMKELGDEMGQGEAHWLAYAKRTAELDAWFVSIRPKAEAVMAVFSKFLHGADPAPIYDLAAAMKELGVKSTVMLTNELTGAKTALSAMLATGTEAPGVIEAMQKKVADLTAQLRGAAESFDQLTLRLFSTARHRLPLEPLPVSITEKTEALPKPNAQRQAALQAQFDWLNAEHIKEAGAAIQMANIWENAMGTMLSSIVSFGSGVGSVFAGVGDIFGNFIKTGISGIEMMALAQLSASKKVIMAKKNESVANYIASIFAKFPPPFNFIAAAGAFALVNALFAKILKFGQGFEGVISRPTPILVGEAGPEYVSVTPMSRGRSSGRAMLAEGPGVPGMAMAGGGSSIVNNFNGPLVSTVRLSDADIVMAGAKVKNQVVYQMRRLGR